MDFLYLGLTLGVFALSGEPKSSQQPHFRVPVRPRIPYL